MSIELALFVLRLLTSFALLAFLFALFFLLWRSLNRGSAPNLSSGRLSRFTDATDGSPEGVSHFALGPITTLGRSATNSIVISDDYASAEHAKIALRDGQWWLEDCGSRNGTALNGDALSGPVILVNGDVIEIGQSRFRFELDLAVTEKEQ